MSFWNFNWTVWIWKCDFLKKIFFDVLLGLHVPQFGNIGPKVTQITEPLLVRFCTRVPRLNFAFRCLITERVWNPWPKYIHTFFYGVTYIKNKWSPILLGTPYNTFMAPLGSREPFESCCKTHIKVFYYLSEKEALTCILPNCVAIYLISTHFLISKSQNIFHFSNEPLSFLCC